MNIGVLVYYYIFHYGMVIVKTEEPIVGFDSSSSTSRAQRLLWRREDGSVRNQGICEWERVTCNSITGHLTKLSLHNIKDLDIDCHYYRYYDLKDVIWFLNVSLFETFQELKSLNFPCNAIGGWIENEGMYFFFFWR